MKKFFKDRYWFGWWWASYCSAHFEYDKTCHMCKGGSWTREGHKKWFGKKNSNSLNIVAGMIAFAVLLLIAGFASKGKRKDKK